MSEVYCGAWWSDFWAPFDTVKIPVFISVCSLGVLVNIINLIVFTRKRMRNPTNLLLTALAVTDFLSVFRLLIRLSLVAYGNKYGEWRSHYHLAIEELIHDILFVVFHTWSIYLTLAIALWRFIGVLYPLKTRSWFTWRAAKLSVILALTFSSLLLPLIFYDRHIALKSDGKERQIHRYLPTCKELEGFDDSPYEMRRSILGEQIAWWVHGIVIKIVPCITMTILSMGLVISLVKAGRIRKRLRTPGNTSFKEAVKNSKLESELSNKSLLSNKEQKEIHIKIPTAATGAKGKRENNNKDGEDFHRTTKMLLVVLLLFLITEFPFGIFGVIRVIIDRMDFYEQCYLPVRAFFNLNEYLSCVTSFFVYLIMSVQFRTTLRQIRTSGFKSIRSMSWNLHANNSNSNSNSSTATALTPHSSSRKFFNSSFTPNSSTTTPTSKFAPVSLS